MSVCLLPGCTNQGHSTFSIVPSSACGSPAVHVSVLMLDGQTGELPLQLTKARLGCQIGAQEQSTQNVSEMREG